MNRLICGGSTVTRAAITRESVLAVRTVKVPRHRFGTGDPKSLAQYYLETSGLRFPAVVLTGVADRVFITKNGV